MSNKPSISILIEHPNDILEVINAADDQEAKAIMVPDQIKQEIKFDMPTELHIIFQLIKGFVASLATEDPTKVHYANARAALKKVDNSLLQETEVIDMLARKLVELCRDLNAELKMPAILQDALKEHESTLAEFPPESGRVKPDLSIIRLNISPEEEIRLFESGGMFIWDKIYLDILKSTGKAGSEAAKSYGEEFCQRLQAFKANKKSPLKNWFSLSSSMEKPFHISPTLQDLTKHIFKDIVKSKIDFAKQVPTALTSIVQNNLCGMLSTKTSIERSQHEIKLYRNSHLVGSIPLLAIDPNIIKLVLAGFAEQDLASLTAVRLICHFATKTHENLKNGVIDYHILKYPGRAKEVAAALGLKSGKDRITINRLIHIFDNLKLYSSEINSRLIALAECAPQSRYSSQGGWQITVLSPLLPYHFFRDPSKSFIMPLIKEPKKFVGHSKYHGRQIIMQWEIVKEFCLQSKELYQTGSIILIDEKLEEIAYQCNIPKTLTSDIIAAWTGPEGFLKKVDASRYTLTGEDDALAFLKENGRQKAVGSQLGRKSDQNRKKKKQEIKLLLSA